MRPSLGKILLLLVAILAALLIWVWWSDVVLIHKCENAGGRWDADARVCLIPVIPDREVPASHLV